MSELQLGKSYPFKGLQDGCPRCHGVFTFFKKDIYECQQCELLFRVMLVVVGVRP